MDSNDDACVVESVVVVVDVDVDVGVDVDVDVDVDVGKGRGMWITTSFVWRGIGEDGGDTSMKKGKKKKKLNPTKRMLPRR
jgi:hypothetical protein